MLKTNSRKASENIRNYIVENFDGTNYDIETPETFEEVARIILDTFRKEYRHEYECRRHTERESFREWSAGLPSILDTCYFYNRSAVDDLGTILEQTEEQRSKYTEEQAENTLTALIYRELAKAEGKRG